MSHAKHVWRRYLITRAMSRVARAEGQEGILLLGHEEGLLRIYVDIGFDDHDNWFTDPKENKELAREERLVALALAHTLSEELG